MAESEAHSEETPRRWGVVQLAVALALAALAIYFARAPSEVSIAEDDAAGRAAAKPAVPVVRPIARRASRQVRATGVVAITAGVRVHAQVGGEVVFVSPSLQSGGAFTAGQPLVRIAREDFELALDSAEAALRHAEARLAKQRLQGAAGAQKFQRENPGAEVPPLVARVPHIAREQARVDRAKNNVTRARIDLRRTTVALPFAGRVRGSNIHKGQIVVPAAVLGQVFADGAVEVRAEVSEQDLADVALANGSRARVEVGAVMLDAVVQRVSATVDPQSRLARAFLTFAEDVAAEDVPRPGTFVSVVFHGPPMEGVFVLPEAAEQAQGSVWVVAGGALKSVTPRSLGRTREGWLVAPFEVGQGVALGPVPQGREGLPVEPRVEAAGS